MAISYKGHGKHGYLGLVGQLVRYMYTHVLGLNCNLWFSSRIHSDKYPIELGRQDSVVLFSAHEASH